MKRIRLKGRSGVMACEASDIDGFPGAVYTLAYPEAIGDAAKPGWYGEIRPTWEEAENGAWISRGGLEDELAYEIHMTPGSDTVTTRFRLTNSSGRTWTQSMAFNCFQCARDSTVRDNECTRTWVRTGGEFKRLTVIPRVFGARPAVQLYSVEGAPLGREIPFVAGFEATPDVVIEPWMAIVARDGSRMVATVSTPGLFLFQNREYSCIHCATGFGRLEPGESGEAVNRTYFVSCGLNEWHERMLADCKET